MNIVPRFVDLDECAINQPNAKLMHGGAQHKFPLWSGLLDLIPNCIIDAKCNKNGVITNCTFWSIPQKNIIHVNIIMFHVQNEFQKALLKA
jgi:hypothetical protein